MTECWRYSLLTKLKRWIKHPTDKYEIDQFYDLRQLMRTYSYFGGLFTTQFVVDHASGQCCLLSWSRYIPYDSYDTFAFLCFFGSTLETLDLYEEPGNYTPEDIYQIMEIINEYAKRKPIDRL